MSFINQFEYVKIKCLLIYFIKKKLKTKFNDVYSKNMKFNAYFYFIYMR